MDARLDPACEGARALAAKQHEQVILLAGGSEGQLAQVVRNTHERQVTAHIGGCSRCSSYRTAFCAECGFDLRTEPHGWRCARGPRSWTDYLPWNWRPKKAPRRRVVRR
ncbi:MAG TPA: hypothetical protein VFH78_01445, partial [Candidatus Thermoplasmatota archaeon]|nr:hypothetical protein [Candidatus Thermoplasmatota archaeon]